MGAVTIDNTSRSAMADAYDDQVNTGSGTATIEIRTASGGGGTLLATFSLPNPAFGAAANGVLTLNGTPISATIAATGTASHCRIKDRNGTVRGDGTVTATGGGGLIEFATVSFVSGATARITGGTMTQPAS